MAVASPAVDEVFAEPLDRVGDFTFNEQVAGVFDDMVSRSVPQYAEIQRMLAELTAYFATEGSNIYDLGCSTGTTLTSPTGRCSGSPRGRSRRRGASLKPASR